MLDLVEIWETRSPPERERDLIPPGLPFNLEYEPLPHLVLAKFHLQAGQSKESSCALVLTSTLQDPAHSLLGPKVLCAQSIHHDMTVTLQQGHERLNLVDDGVLLRAREKPEETPLVDQRPACIAP